jgi:hypothetical protein
VTELPTTDAQSFSISVVESSGLFDREWYAASHQEINEGDALQHYCVDGWRQQFAPNPYFDPVWYTKTYRAELLPDENPLVHYIRRGERENAWPSPHFDPEWYRDEYAIGQESPLGHYLRSRRAGQYSPIPGFDAAAYSEMNPDCLALGLDPYLHWLQRPKEELDDAPISESPWGTVLQMVGGIPAPGSVSDSVTPDGLKEALRLFIPFIPFDDGWYCKQYPDVAAAVECGLMASAHEHFISYGFFEGRTPAAKWRWGDLEESS